MKKSLGQNFLTSVLYPRRIAKAAYENGEILNVLEIGAGEGILTTELAKLFKRVVSIEIDLDLKDKLTSNISGYDNIELVFADFQKIQKAIFFEEKFGNEPFVVCANIPYYITSPIISGLLEYNSENLKTVTVLIQKEAAERFAFLPGENRNCSAASVMSNYYSTSKILFGVKRGNFFPVPDVDSAVINFDKRKPFEAVTENEREIYFRIVKTVFRERRKQIVGLLATEFKIVKNEMSGILLKNEINPSARAENLTMKDFQKIRNIISYEYIRD